MANSGWTADKLNVIYPPGAIAPDTFIYIGDAAGDPTGTLDIAGLDAGIVFAFGDGYSFVLGVFQEVGFNDGHLFLGGVDPFTGLTQTNRLIETDWQPDSAGGGANFFEIGNSQPFIDFNGIGIDFLASSSDIDMVASGDITFGNSSLFPANPLDVINADGAMQVFGNEIGRGLLMSNASAGSSAAIGTTLTTVMTLSNRIYRKNRCYRVTIQAGISGAGGATIADTRLFKASTAGQSLGEFYRFPILAGGAVGPHCGFRSFVTGPNDVTTTIVCAIRSDVGTVTQFGAANTPRMIEVEDVGAASQSSPGSLPVLV